MSTRSSRDSVLTPACRAASLFVDYLNSRDFESIGRLFADPTDVIGPDGTKYHHPAEVVDFIGRGFGAMTTRWCFKVANLVPVGENGCLLEFEVSEEDGAFEPVAVDHFEVSTDGKIVRFLPYVAANRAAKTAALQEKVRASREAGQSPQS